MDTYLLEKIFLLLPNDLKALSNVCPHFNNIIVNHPLLCRLPYYVDQLGLTENLLEYAKEHNMKDLQEYAKENIKYKTGDSATIDTIWMNDVNDVCRNNMIITTKGNRVQCCVLGRQLMLKGFENIIRLGYIPENFKPYRDGTYCVIQYQYCDRMKFKTRDNIIILEITPHVGIFEFPTINMTWFKN